jgi:hypothetical protein
MTSCLSKLSLTTCYNTDIYACSNEAALQLHRFNENKNRRHTQNEMDKMSNKLIVRLNNDDNTVNTVSALPFLQLFPMLAAWILCFENYHTAFRQYYQPRD